MSTASRPATSGSCSSNGAALHTFICGDATDIARGALGEASRSGCPKRAQVVDHPDAEQKARHRLPGTPIDVRNGLKACDPKRLTIYFTKHSAPNMNGDTEYQHIVPELWRRLGRGSDRFWGEYGLKKAIAVVEVAQDAYVAARRIVRRWSRSQAVYGDPASRFPTAVVPLVPRVDRETGVVAHRRVRRRRMLCNQGGLAGGYALVNDGPAFAAQLARATS